MNHEYILYRKIAQFQNRFRLNYHYSIYNLANDLNIGLMPYSGTGIKKLLAVSEDGFSIMQDGEYFIFYNPDMIPARRNFTIAHEIGHIILNHHRLSKSKVLAKNGAHKIIERQANIFAQNLLMPADSTAEIRDIKTIAELAEMYEVSKQMVYTRLKNLNYDLKWLRYVKEEL